MEAVYQYRGSRSIRVLGYVMLPVDADARLLFYPPPKQESKSQTIR